MKTEPVALIFEDKYKLVYGFTEFFLKLASNSNTSLHIALSGGNTPKSWFDHLANNHKNDIAWNKIHLYWGDERCVPPEHRESNFGMTKHHLLDLISIPECNIHRIRGEHEPRAEAQRYEAEIISNLGENPVFDLIILGMGDDGHTASIFPHEIALWNSPALTVIATHPETGQNRISLTGNVINNSASVAFLVSGQSKWEKVRDIILQKPGSYNYPAGLVNLENGSLFWFLDKDAARGISE